MHAMEVPRERLDLRDNRELLSPPIVLGPLYACARAIVVVGFVPDATIDVRIDGVDVVTGFPGGFPEPDGVLIAMPSPLVANQAVQARQHWDGRTSGWSAAVVVRDHRQDYPAGPPRPEVNPAPLHECGSRTGVANLLIGCNVWIEADGAEVGRVDGAGPHQGVDVNPDYGRGQHVRAFAELCGDRSPPSELHITQLPPSPLPVPAFEPVFDEGRQVVVTNLANGARFEVFRGGVSQGISRTWGQRHLVALNPPLVAGETLVCVQRLCPGNPGSSPGSTTVQPCSALPAPTVAPIQVGDTAVRLLTFVPDAVVRVYRNLQLAGLGGGSLIALDAPVAEGDVIHVVQDLGRCQGLTAQQVGTACVAPPVAASPASLNLFPVGHTTYDDGARPIGTRTYSVKGTVYYPADDDGDRMPFNRRLADLGPVPIVFMAHGNHSPADPSHLGYDYFQHQLARMGVIAVSVFLNETNGATGGLSNITDRAGIVIAGIQHFRDLSNGGDAIFGGRVDIGRIGLMGHSRGGEAVIAVPERMSIAGADVRAVLSLAPVEWGATSGVPRGYAFMTILPAADGDVYTTPGARFYDRARPEPFRSQVYVHHANHNWFNRQWTNDDANGILPLMSVGEHERILSAYGCALFRAALLGHATVGYLDGTVLPAGVSTHNVQLAFERRDLLTVDHHEDGNGVGANSLGQPTAQAGLSAGEYRFAPPPLAGGGHYADSFFGDSRGLVAEPGDPGGVFTSELGGARDLTGAEIWIRAADVFRQRMPRLPTSFDLGLRDEHGAVAWVSSNDAGGLPLPFDRAAWDAARASRLRSDGLTTSTKTMLSTFRFQASCFVQPRGELRLDRVDAVLLRLAGRDDDHARPIAFDDVQIVRP
jgi:dienelactone hydrolase